MQATDEVVRSFGVARVFKVRCLFLEAEYRCSPAALALTRLQVEHTDRCTIHSGTCSCGTCSCAHQCGWPSLASSLCCLQALPAPPCHDQLTIACAGVQRTHQCNRLAPPRRPDGHQRGRRCHPHVQPAHRRSGAHAVLAQVRRRARLLHAP